MKNEIAILNENDLKNNIERFDEEVKIISRSKFSTLNDEPKVEVII